MADVEKVTRSEASKEELEELLERILTDRHSCWSGEEIVNTLKRRGYELKEIKQQPVLWAPLSEVFHKLGLTIALHLEGTRWQLQIYGSRHREQPQKETRP